VGDFQRNDEVYDAIDAMDAGKRSMSQNLDKERAPRSPQAMKEEAHTLRAVVAAAVESLKAES
jgi:hypothetical protein